MEHSDRELLMYQKATVLDLLLLFNSDRDKTYTVDEIEAVLHSYIESQEKG